MLKLKGKITKLENLNSIFKLNDPSHIVNQKIIYSLYKRLRFKIFTIASDNLSSIFKFNDPTRIVNQKIFGCMIHVSWLEVSTNVSYVNFVRDFEFVITFVV